MTRSQLDDMELEDLKTAAGGAKPDAFSANRLAALDATTDEMDAQPGEPETAFGERMMSILEMQKRARASYPLALSREECLGMDTRSGPGKIYLEDSIETGFDPVDDPRTEEAKAGLARAFAQWRREGKGSREWYDDWACSLCRACERARTWKGRKTGFYFHPQYVLECPCRKMWRMDKQLREKLPPSLRNHSINSLKPSPDSNLPAARQEKEIAFLKEHRTEGFFFLGPPGTSKSTFAAALFKEALWRDVNGKYGGFLWRVDGSRLLEQEQAWALANDKSEVRRDVTVEDIERARKRGFRPVLLLEEMDKRRMTEFAVNIFFRLVNAMDECEGQLILTTNLTMGGFRDLFLKSGVEAVQVTGEALLRRVLKANVRDYHGQQ